MDETQQNLVGQNLQILPRNLYAEDGDRGIAAPILYSFDQQSTWTAADNQQQQSFNVNHYLHLNPGSGEIRLLRQWPALGGQQRAAGLFGGGGGGAQMTLVVRATQADNKDRYTLTTLTVTTTGTLRSSSSLPYHHLSGNNNQPASSVSATTANETHGGGGAKQQGIEFEQSQLSVRVPESAPVNEKIARVRARYIQAAAAAASLQLATDESLQPVDVLSGANSGAAEQAGKKQPASTRGRQLQATGAEQRRPINYQILDDQTDQFGINGLGEIFIKRQLDYEHKQEFRFRVLATYLKHSDICRVHVEVLNVNDNKPKVSADRSLLCRLRLRPSPPTQLNNNNNILRRLECRRQLEGRSCVSEDPLSAVRLFVYACSPVHIPTCLPAYLSVGRSFEWPANKLIEM